MVAQDMANEYARNARSFTGKPYGRRWRKNLARWWMAGYRNETQGFPQIGTNFEAPLRDAWAAGAGRVTENHLRKAD